MFAAGVFYNSERRVSFMAGVALERGNWWLDLGLATGYSGGGVVPFVRGGYRINHTYVFVAPAYRADTHDAGLVLGVERRF